jgi:hypothetical protein
MSSVSTSVRCPQCGYAEANEDFNCKNSSWSIVCRRCGYYESETPKYDKDRRVRLPSACTFHPSHFLEPWNRVSGIDEIR